MQFRKRSRTIKNPFKKKTGAKLLDFFSSRFGFKHSSLRSFIRQHHFMLGFLLLALVAGAMGGLYDGASKKLAERPGSVMAAAGDINWEVPIHLSNWDEANSLVINSSGIYVAGNDNTLGNFQWRTQKIGLDGSLGWVKTLNYTSGFEVANNIAVDSTGLYVVGEAKNLGGEWLIQKYDLNGNDGFMQLWDGSNLRDDESYDVAVDGSGVYVVGMDSINSITDVKWRIHKYSLNGSTLLWATTSNPSTWADAATDIAIDTTGIYVAGYDYSSGSYGWRIQKYNLNGTTLLWATSTDPSPSPNDRPTDIAVDGSGVYVSGLDGSGSGGRWRINKYSLNGSSLMWSVTSDPSSGSDNANAIAVDGTGVYVAGADYVDSYASARVEKFSLSGLPVWNHRYPAANGGDDYLNGIALDNAAIYVAGMEFDAGGNIGWRVMKIYKDETPPSVKINLPTNQPNLTTALNRIRIAGTSTDDVAVTQVRWSNDRGGSGTMVGTSTWLYNNVTLQSGANVISVSARDAAGNWATSTLTVTFNAVANPNFFKTIYGPAAQYQGFSIQSTHDGGYIADGLTTLGGGSGNAMFIKLFPSGSIEWTKTIIGPFRDSAKVVRQTSDGGYIAAGYTFISSIGTDDRFYVVKLNSAGDVQWSRYIAANMGSAQGVQETADGGFVAAGAISMGLNNKDIYVVKFDKVGNIIWQNTYGGASDELAYSLDSTGDGGFIIAGTTGSFGTGVLLLLKLNSDGSIGWSKTYDSGANEWGYSVKNTNDGGFILAGQTGGANFYVIKVDSLGNVLWSKQVDRIYEEIARTVIQTEDGNFIVAGWSKWASGDSDIFLVKLDSATGDKIWSKIIGDGNVALSWAYDFQPMADGGFAFIGEANVGFGGVNRTLAMKLDSNGECNTCSYINAPTAPADSVTDAIATPAVINPTITPRTYTAIDPGFSSVSQTLTEVSYCEADTTAPFVPTGLTATPFSSTQIDLTWNAATDNPSGPVAGYRVYRGPLPIGTTTLTSFSDTGLTPSTAYDYYISAYDAALNSSALSAPPVTATTLAFAPDTTKPMIFINGPASFSTSTSPINISGTAVDY